MAASVEKTKNPLNSIIVIMETELNEIFVYS